MLGIETKLQIYGGKNSFVLLIAIMVTSVHGALVFCLFLVYVLKKVRFW